MASFVTMPEAAMNEYRSLSSRQHDIWSAGEIDGVKTIAETGAMQASAKSQLWLGILAADTGHHA